jgi:flagellin-specific chaperone FliS
MNQNQSAADAYRRASLENAPPIKIIRMLYQGALRFLEEAAATDPRLALPRFQDRLHRAEAVVVELRISLEEYAPEPAASLERSTFVEDKIHGQSKAARSSYHARRSVLQTLYSAWQGIEVDTAPGSRLMHAAISILQSSRAAPRSRSSGPRPAARGRPLGPCQGLFDRYHHAEPDPRPCPSRGHRADRRPDRVAPNAGRGLVAREATLAASVRSITGSPAAARRRADSRPADLGVSCDLNG